MLALESSSTQVVETVATGWDGTGASTRRVSTTSHL